MRLLLILPLAAAIAGCGGGSSGSGGGGRAQSGGASAPARPAKAAAAVEIRDFRFTVPTVTVAAGGTVTWTNRDSAPHNAVGASFKTRDLQQGDSDTVTFKRPGTYRYMCTFHPYMKATVVVR